MPNKNSEYDYLHLSARLRCREGRLLTRERMERMLDARSVADAAKVAAECGYPELGEVTPAAVEDMLRRGREQLYAELVPLAPQRELLDVFRMKYDYHNLKTLLKARARGIPCGELLSAAGRWAPGQLEKALEEGDLSLLPQALGRAVQDAQRALKETGDPQKAEFILDRAYYAELAALAGSVGSTALEEYVRISVDAANLRAAVRCVRMGRGAELLQEVLVRGGSIAEEKLLEAARGERELAPLFARTPLETAAQEGAKAMSGGPLTAFERACDNAVTAVVRRTGRVPFGEQVLLGYLYARESEQTAIRVLLNGKLAGLDRARLEERLREAYA